MAAYSVCLLILLQVTATPSAASRVDDLLAQMTLEEKLGQLTMQPGGEFQDTNPGLQRQKQEDLFGVVRVGAVGSLIGAHGAEYTNRLQRIAVEESRLGIPLVLGNDVIHGYRTVFPIPLGEAATWNPELVTAAARVAATEARATGTHWTFAPMVDVCRDPRWGRIAETAGEDPWLGSKMSAARVRGFQGDNLARPDTVMACLKHYAAYGAGEGGRDYNTVDISLRTLHEIHLPTFKAGVDAGARTLMSAFNEIAGIPATGSDYILREVLRDQWGFDGFVVSDWTSVTEMVAHGFARDAADAAEIAIRAGVDMDMSSFSYRDHLDEAVKQGRLDIAIVDDAVRRVLHAKFELGLFDDPYIDPEIEKRVILSDEHRALAREVARQSFVLIKNENDALPLRPDLKRIALIGPLADSQKDPLGTWAGKGEAKDVISVLAGLRTHCGDQVVITHVAGCDVRDANIRDFDAAVAAAESADMTILVLGESSDMSGEGYSRASIDLPGAQRELAKAIHATGRPYVVVVLNGRPLALPWLAEHAPAILIAWHPGVECGNALADVLFGDFNPCGKLPATFPRSGGQIPLYYNHKNTGRPANPDNRFTSKYIDVPWTPQYAFGHGLSYTTFSFDNLTVEPTDAKPGDTITVSVDVRNTGQRPGVEVAQLYIRDLVGSVTRPVKELRGCERVDLKPGESRRVAFALSSADLAVLNAEMRPVLEPGEFDVWIGPASDRGPSARFRVVDE